MGDAARGRLLDWAPQTARADGLASVGLGDRVEIEGSGPALVVALGRDHVDLVPLSSVRPEPRASVLAAGPLQVPAGDSLIGRAIDATGRPLDGLGAIGEDGRHPVFFAVPTLRPEGRRRRLSLGLWVYDFKQPVWVGANVLAVGKAAHVARHLLRHQAREGRVCIYALLMPGSSVVSASRALERHDQRLAPAEWIDSPTAARAPFIVVEPGPSPTAAAIGFIPWSAMAIAAWFREQGRDAVVLLDSLDRWRRGVAALAWRGSWTTQLGRLMAGSFARPEGSVSLISLAAASLLPSAAPLADEVIDLDCALRGLPKVDGSKLLRPPFTVSGLPKIGAAMAALAELGEWETSVPWLLPPGAQVPDESRRRIDEAFRYREALRYRPQTSPDLLEQLVAFLAVCDRPDVPADGVPALIDEVLHRVRRDHAALLADIRTRRAYREQDHDALMAAARLVTVPGRPRP